MQFVVNLKNNFILIHALDNWCSNALDLSNSKLIVESNWPVGTNCKWLISAVDDKHYVNLEFENVDVRIAEFTSLHTMFNFVTYHLFRSLTGQIDLKSTMDLMNRT